MYLNIKRLSRVSADKNMCRQILQNLARFGQVFKTRSKKHNSNAQAACKFYFNSSCQLTVAAHLLTERLSHCVDIDKTPSFFCLVKLI